MVHFTKTADTENILYYTFDKKDYPITNFRHSTSKIVPTVLQAKNQKWYIVRKQRTLKTLCNIFAQKGLTFCQQSSLLYFQDHTHCSVGQGLEMVHCTKTTDKKDYPVTNFRHSTSINLPTVLLFQTKTRLMLLYATFDIFQLPFLC